MIVVLTMAGIVGLFYLGSLFDKPDKYSEIMMARELAEEQAQVRREGRIAKALRFALPPFQAQ